MILVTGGLGFIGSHTVRALLDLGESCLVSSRRPDPETPEFLAGAITVEQADCTDLPALLALGDRYPITGIVHLAAGTVAADPLVHLRTSAQAVLNGLAAARAWGVRRIVLASTIGVYGGAPGPVYREDMPLPMVAPHAIPAAKKAAELYGEVVADGFTVVNARIGSIWGPRGRPDSLFDALPRLVHAAARGIPAERPAYAEDGMDRCYVADCARALALLATADTLRHRTYNVGTGRITRNAEVVEAIRAVRPDPPVDLLPGRTPDRPADAVLDIARLSADTGYKPAYDTRRGIAEYLDWLSRHPR